jgi:hypothetical protein
LQEFLGGKKDEVCKAQKWMKKVNKWFENLNILQWEKLSS